MSEGLTLEEHSNALDREETYRRAYDSIVLEYRLSNDKSIEIEKAKKYVAENEISDDFTIQGRVDAYLKFLEDAEKGNIE